MVGLVLLLLQAVLAVAVDSWCPGVPVPSLETGAGNIDVIFAQAALFSTNPKFGDSLAQYNLFHTAVVFQQAERSWTLEFDLIAQNKGGHTQSSGFVPDIQGSTLTWDNAARWCLTEGILNNRSHWKQTWEVMATISPAQFNAVFTDVVLPKNKTVGEPPYYNAFRVIRIDEVGSPIELIDDITCANGAIWIRDYLRDQQVETADLDYNVTRFNINAGEIRDADMSDAAVLTDITTFYQHLGSVLNELPSGPVSFLAWLQSLFGVLPMRYVYDGKNGKYMEVVGNAAPYLEVVYESAPSSWVPSPPAPPGPSTTGIREICVTNSGGYALEWQLTFGKATSSLVKSYPAGQTRCLTGGQAGAVDRQEIGCVAHAIAGSIVSCVEGPDRLSAYSYGSAADIRANYKCDGTTTTISCYLTGFEHIEYPPAPTPAPPPTVREICVDNRGGYALWWKLTDGEKVSDSTGSYPNPQTRCLSGSVLGATDGDELGCIGHAIAGKTVDCVGTHKYSSTSGLRANYRCGGSTLSISCLFTGLSSITGQHNRLLV